MGGRRPLLPARVAVDGHASHTRVTDGEGARTAHRAQGSKTSRACSRDLQAHGCPETTVRVAIDYGQSRESDAFGEFKSS